MIDPATILFLLSAAGLKALKAKGVDASSAGGEGTEIGAELLTVLFAHHATEDIRGMQQRFADWLKGPAPHKNRDLERAIARSEILADLFCLIEALPGGIRDAEHKSWLRSVVERLPETLKRSERGGFFAESEKAQIRAAKAVCEARLKGVEEEFEASEIEPSILLKREIDGSISEKLGRESAHALEERETFSGHKVGALPERVCDIFAHQWFPYLTHAFRHELKNDGPVFQIYTTMRLESGFGAVSASVRDEGQKTRDHIDSTLGQRLDQVLTRLPPASAEEVAIPSAVIELTVDFAHDPHFNRSIEIRPIVPVFKVGDEIRIFARVSADCYLLIFDIGAHGIPTILFPNSYQRYGRLAAAQWHSFPPVHSMYSFPLTDPVGIEKILGVASVRPLDMSRIGLRNVDDYKNSTAQVLANHIFGEMSTEIIGASLIEFHITSN